MSTSSTNHRRKGARSVFSFVVLLSVIVAASAVGLLSQWRESVRLRVDRDLAQMERLQLERLRAENTRLREKQISDSELQVLRADHAALPRLRAEVEALSH